MLNKKTIVSVLICSSVFSFVGGNKVSAISLLVTGGNQIGEINTTNGSFTTVNTDGPVFTDIALRESGTVFGNTFSSLYEVDLTTNTNTFIGNFNVSNDINALGFSNGDILYGTSQSGGFYSINTTNGNASLIADIPGFASAGDIVFNPDNNEFLATSTTPSDSTLFSIALNGTATQIGNIGFPNVFGIFFENQTLFGYTAGGQQLIIDRTTGIGTFDKNITGFNGGINGAGSLPSTGPQPPNPPTTPEPNSMIGLLALGILGGVSRLKSSQK